MFTLGSAWAIDDPNIGQVLVTAGHVLGINSTPKPICKQMVTANGIINMSHPGEDATDDYGSYATQDYTKKVAHLFCLRSNRILMDAYFHLLTFPTISQTASKPGNSFSLAGLGCFDGLSPKTTLTYCHRPGYRGFHQCS